MSARWRLSALWGSIALATGAAGATLTLPSDPLRAGLGLVAALLLPGFAILSASAPSLALRRIEGLLAVIALSVASDVCGGLILAVSPVGLTRQSSAVGVVLLVVAPAAIAIARLRGERVQRPSPHAPPGGDSRGEVERPGRLRHGERWRGRRQPQVWLAGFTAIVAAGLAAGALVMASRSAAVSGEFASTSVSMVAVGPSHFRLRITNHGRRPVSARVTVTTGRITIARFRDISVRSGLTWSHLGSWPASLRGATISAVVAIRNATAQRQRVFLYVG